MRKPQRWYRVEGETLYVYDHWSPERAGMVSMTSLADLPFYRASFTLRACC